MHQKYPHRVYGVPAPCETAIRADPFGYAERSVRNGTVYSYRDELCGMQRTR